MKRKRTGRQGAADGLRLAEQQRVSRQLERGREVLGSRALSAQVAEYACGSDAGELAELYGLRLVMRIRS